jgi:hypothetical protein
MLLSIAQMLLENIFCELNSTIYVVVNFEIGYLNMLDSHVLCFYFEFFFFFFFFLGGGGVEN